MRLFFFVAGTLLILLCPVVVRSGDDHYTLTAALVNQFSETIYAPTIITQYGDWPINKKTWDKLASGSTTDDNVVDEGLRFQYMYHGWVGEMWYGETSNWWIVHWQTVDSAGNHYLHVINPHNWQEVFDFIFSEIVPFAAKAFSEIAKIAVDTDEEIPEKEKEYIKLGVDIAEKFADKLAERLAEGTHPGFKKCGVDGADAQFEWNEQRGTFLTTGGNNKNLKIVVENEGVSIIPPISGDCPHTSYTSKYLHQWQWKKTVSTVTPEQLLWPFNFLGLTSDAKNSDIMTLIPQIQQCLKHDQNSLTSTSDIMTLIPQFQQSLKHGKKYRSSTICTKKNGICKKHDECKGKYMRGLCPGGKNWQCCVDTEHDGFKYKGKKNCKGSSTFACKFKTARKKYIHGGSKKYFLYQGKKYSILEKGESQNKLDKKRANHIKRTGGQLRHQAHD